MEQFEKVCKGLEHEMQNRGQCGHYCREGVETVSCRYDKSGLCIQHWGKDALALIRQQQERIKELEEVREARIMSISSKKCKGFRWKWNWMNEQFRRIIKGMQCYQRVNNTNLCKDSQGVKND